jgi:hypothetical protein
MTICVILLSFFFFFFFQIFFFFSYDFFFLNPFLIIGCSHPSDFFFLGGKNLPFWFFKKIQSNMVKGTIWKISKKNCHIFKNLFFEIVKNFGGFG